MSAAPWKIGLVIVLGRAAGALIRQALISWCCRDHEYSRRDVVIKRTAALLTSSCGRRMRTPGGDGKSFEQSNPSPGRAACPRQDVGHAVLSLPPVDAVD